MNKLRVAILLGGKSGEHEVSIVSALSIFKALDKNKYDITLIGIDKEGRWLMPDQTALLAQSTNPRNIKLTAAQNLVSFLPYESRSQVVPVAGAQVQAPEKFDVILPILHGTNGEDGTVQGLLELASVAYVGSGVLGSSVGMDKDMAKRVMRDAGLPVVPFLAVRKSEFERDSKRVIQMAEKEFGYPYFVKPSNMGSSVGVHKVKSSADAQKFIADSFLYDTKILIEKAVNARELECAVLGNDDAKASIIGEIIPNHEFYTYDAKYIDANGAALKIPAVGLSTAQTQELQDLAVRCFHALELRGLARVDFFMDKNSGEIFINEVNTIPGFTQISMYPKLWEASGLPYAKLLDRLIELALEVRRDKNKLKTTWSG